MSRLAEISTESANKLQEPIITQRDGRYVIPLRAEFKGQIKAIVHDQSSSGATLFVEPLPIVELNNSMRELQLQERDEEQRASFMNFPRRSPNTVKNWSMELKISPCSTSSLRRQNMQRN